MQAGLYSDIGYFPTDISLPANLMHSIETLQQQLMQQIQMGEIQVLPKQEMKIDQNKKQKNLKLKLKQLDTVKEQLLNKLKQIQVEQDQIKAIDRKIKEKKKKSKLQKSQLTEQQKQKIAKVKRSRKQFEEMIKNKIDQMMVSIKQKQKQQEQQKAFKLSMKKKQRVVKLAQKRLMTEQSRVKQLDLLHNSHKGINKNNYIYIKNELRDQKLQNERKKYAQVVLNEKRQKMKVDFDIIKKHSIEHQKVVAEHKQCRSFELQQQQMRKRSKTINYQSSFTQKIKQDQRLQKIQKMRKLNLKREARMKVMNFGDYIHENFKPKSSEKSQFIPKKQTEVSSQLTHQQIHQKGKEYLQIARERRRKSSSPNSNKSTSRLKDMQALPTSSSQKYPNYLLDLRRNNKNPQNILERMLKQKRLSLNKVDDVIKHIQKKQYGNKIGLNKNPLKRQFSIAFQKISLLNSMFEAEESKDK